MSNCIIAGTYSSGLSSMIIFFVRAKVNWSQGTVLFEDECICILNREVFGRA